MVNSAAIKVFVSYSHNDAALCERLGTHLSLLKRQGIIDEWHDAHIDPGQDWGKETRENLDSAKLILLLVSADFLASDYCYGREMKRALERHDAGDAHVIPVIVRHVYWDGAPFARLQVLPKRGRPITAWRDQDEAFTDVVRGIKRVITKLKEPENRPHRLPPIWKAPPLRNPHFTGRDDLLDDLHTKLTSGRVALTVVHGPFGVGKTQLAVEYVYRHMGEFDLIWWLRAQEHASLLSDYDELARKLSLASAIGLAAVGEVVREKLEHRKRWLLIFDDARGEHDLAQLLPRGGGGRILITSLNQNWSMAERLEVPPLTSDHSAEFLLERTEQHDWEAARKLAGLLGGLPLALEQAAAYVVETACPLAEYVDMLQHGVRIF